MLSLFFHFFVTRWQHPLNTFAAVKSITVFLKKEMNKVFSFIALAFLGCGSAAAQQVNVSNVQRPKLVVGIVVDQMRWDYLYRYQKRYGEGGFKRLLNEGFSCENTRIPYVPSVTAIGHTCLYTGSVPSIHGIAGNNFVKNGKKVYCTDDETVKPVGSNSKAGLMSPRNLWVTTLGDEMKIASNGRAKVVGVALKDRASILPAGHNPNGAYWFDDESGKFITSSYYINQLPKWVDAFNNQHLPERYLSEKWNTLYPENTYVESTEDENEYEDGIRKGMKATLPLNLPALYKKYGYSIIRKTPFGNSLTIDLAKAAIDGEQLGADDETDLLAVSCSSTDYIGHQVGTHAVETEDTYLRRCVQYACDMEKTMTESIPEDVKMRIVNGYNRERSGDVAIVLKPNFYAHGMKGTDHGEWNPYDTHIPLIFMGCGIQHGTTTRQTFMTDIVPTIAALLHVQAPNGCVGQPIF